MRILVYGAGVQGSVFAASLHRAGHDAKILARGQRLADIRDHGIVLETLGTPGQQVTRGRRWSAWNLPILSTL